METPRNAFRAAHLVYGALPKGTAPGDVGLLHADGLTEFVVPGDDIVALEMGIALQSALEAGLLTLASEDGLTVVSVRHGDLEREGW